MKAFKRILVTIFILIIVVLTFRGWIYRHIITYKSTGNRTNFLASDTKLINYIENNIDDKKLLDAYAISKLSLSLTSSKLNFTAGKNNIDPNKLIYSKTAHCIGYAAFYSTTCNYLFKNNNLSENWISKPQIGNLIFFGLNIHKYFNSPFFKDHDFVIIENKSTGEVIAVDPTINDYLFIDFVTYLK